MRVMGISPAHDSSVAVVNNGVLEHFFKEERYTRIKRDKFPIRSILKALEFGAPDMVVLCSPSSNDPSTAYLIKFLEKFIKCPITSYAHQHHLCHASLAFYNSGFDQALTFVIDRNGSLFGSCMREAESVYECSYPCNFEPLYKNYWLFNTGADADADILKADQKFNADRLMSIVKVYESATALIGQPPLENGKVMGLSAYGEPMEYAKLFIDGKPNDSLFMQGNFVEQDNTTVLMRDHLGKVTFDLSKDNYKMYADHAYQVQHQTQEVVLNMVLSFVEKTGINKVCITGGYGLNVVANEYLIKNLPNVEFYFEPLADDSGNSIGAAMHLYRSSMNDSSVNKIQTTFVHGTQHPVELVGEECTVDDIVSLLVDQKVVAVYNGKAESGPRALGNRSILFDARNKHAKDIVNKIKRREWYRPFAGMILEEHFDSYFITHGVNKSEFMTVSYQCKKPEEIPGVCHVDNSCRIQTVDSSIPHIFSLLTKFKEKTSCPVLLNTSFNMAGEPLVETQRDALNTFNSSHIDAVWFPEINRVVMKGSL